MRAMTLVSIFIAGLFAAATPAHAQKGCPDDARAASTALWGTGTIKSGMSVTGTHPCGRRKEFDQQPAVPLALTA